ncbi:MAG: D-alanyl-D-alanine carboxypeptidase [Clostridia bacterium]|nr:D-alanyl-D-alanine carboxypeptidase [Clostridia bacterium]
MKITKAILLSFTIFVIAFSFRFYSVAKASEQSGIVVMEKISERVLYSENADLKLPMASTTKIVTAITVIDNFNIENIVEVPSDFKGVEGSSIYLRPNEKYSVKDLLYGLMLRSGNDSAEILASSFCSRVEFIKLMNETAKKCKASNTNFTNPHGLHDENHYTTAEDLAKITCYALKNETFKSIVSAKKHVATELSSGEKRYWQNKNKMLFNFDGATGVKTGYTVKAGRCLVSSAQRNGMEIICVVLNVYDMFERSKFLLSNAFEEFKLVKLFSKDKFNYKIPDENLNYYDLYAEKDFYYPLSKNDKIHIELNLPKCIKKPSSSQEKIGEIKIYTQKQLIFCQNIYTLI